MSRLSRRVWWAVLATGLTALLLSLVVVVQGLTGPAPATDVAEVRGTAAVGASPSDPAERVRTDRRAPSARVTVSEAVPPARRQVVPPARLRVASVGIDVAVRPTGVGAGRQMRLPGDPRVMGWYRFGPAPASGAGSAVLAGHVDSRRHGIGPLARLGGVAPGDRVDVRLASGRTVRYQVDSVERFDRQRLPDEVFARSGRPLLRVVTCTGPWLPEAGGYQQNLVVTAVPV